MRQNVAYLRIGSNPDALNQEPLLQTTPQRLLSWILLSSLMSAFPSFLSAQAAATASIRGIVTGDDGRPLPARVWLVGAVRPGPQNPQGSFRFDKLQPGRYTLRATYIGYVPADTVLSVAPGAQVRLAIRLVTSPVQLSSMTIRETARDTARKRVIPPPPKRDCGLLFVVSLKMSLCSSPAMFPRVVVYEQKTFQGLNARILEAAQESVRDLGFVTERIVQLTERTWLVLARDRVPYVEAGSTRIEVVEINADNTAVRISMITLVSRQRETARRARGYVETVTRKLR